MIDPKVVKTFIGLIKELVGAGFKIDAKHKGRLGKNLREIAELLETTKDQLANGMVPRESSHQVATLINFTNDTLQGVFKIPNADELDDIFSKQLPHIGYLLRSADVFIDGKPRTGRHKYMYGLEARDGDYQVSPQSVSSAIEEIERAAGRLRGAANFLDPNAGISRNRKSSSKAQGLKYFEGKHRSKERFGEEGCQTKRQTLGMRP
ncbi:hypothetical protein [Bradyrhizobium diazoefficiens]|uniref:hypothetical protein n=1 Tax=Bradyrhizobium diazoefficiens TaxID=1355477 RepID=UPI0038367C6C